MTMTEPVAPSSRERWEIAFLGFLCLFFNAGIGFFVFPIMKQPFQDSFNWSDFDMDLGMIGWCLAGAIFSPICGKAIDRFGPRRIILTGSLLQIAVTFSFPYMTELNHLYALFVFSSLANVANTYIPVATAVEQWFDEDQGKAMGLAMLGMGVGGFFATTMCEFLLRNLSWQQTYQVFALGLVFMFFVTLWRFKDSPIFTHDSQADDVVSVVGLTLLNAVKSRSFWAIGLADGVIGMVYNIFQTQMPRITQDAGYSTTTGAWALGLFLFFQSVGLIIFGVLADSKPLKSLMFICYLGPALATLAMLKVEFAVFLFTFTVIGGILGGGRQALFPLALGHSFGVAHMGTIYGALNVLFYLGMAIGPAMASGLFDAQGHFFTVYGICIVLGVGAGAGITLMRKEY